MKQVQYGRRNWSVSLVPRQSFRFAEILTNFRVSVARSQRSCAFTGRSISYLVQIIECGQRVTAGISV